MTPDVIDISHHNDVVSWSQLKAEGIKGVILKCTQGTKYADPTYAERRSEARAAGLLTGAYHFATNADSRAQVDWFLAHAQVDDDTLIALDWENNPDGPDMSVALARLFLEYLMLRTGRDKRHLVVYGGNVLKEHVTAPDDVQFFGDFRLWLCQYGPQAHCPPAWPKYWLWQYSETAKIAGMAPDGHVDANVFGGADLAAEWAPGLTLPLPVTQDGAQGDLSSQADSASDKGNALPGTSAAVSEPPPRVLGDTIDRALTHAEAHKDLLASSWSYWTTHFSIKTIVGASAGVLAFAKDYALLVASVALLAIVGFELVRYMQRNKAIGAH